MNSYKVTFRFYDITPKVAYIKAENQADAFVKAHAFISPDDNCCEIIPERIRNADVPAYTEVCRIRGWELEALIHAEDIGVYEYKVDGAVMRYWSLYDGGFYFITHNLETGAETRELMIPWQDADECPEYGFSYNYFVG